MAIRTSVLTAITCFGTLLCYATIACSSDDDTSGNRNNAAGTGNPGSGGTLASGGSLGSGGSVNIGGLSFGGNTNGSGGSNSDTSCQGKLTGYVRDFKDTHPDFEPAKSGKRVDGVLETNMVEETLGEDKKPVYAKGDGSTSETSTGKDNFDQWFRDIETINMGMPLTLQFARDAADPNKWVYQTDAFFPIDNQLFGNQGAGAEVHNFHFTFELHTLFRYTPGQVFRFRGDDDVWVFIDNKRVIDLGGIHNPEEDTVNVDTLGLVEGQEYPLDFFFAERHVYGSNFLIETSIDFTKCDIVVK